MTLENVTLDIENNPNDYTVWFKIIFEEYLSQIENSN